MAYLPRIADHILKEYLEAFGAVLIDNSSVKFAYSIEYQ